MQPSTKNFVALHSPIQILMWQSINFTRKLETIHISEAHTSKESETSNQSTMQQIDGAVQGKKQKTPCCAAVADRLWNRNEVRHRESSLPAWQMFQAQNLKLWVKGQWHCVCVRHPTLGVALKK